MEIDIPRFIDIGYTHIESQIETSRLESFTTTDATISSASKLTSVPISHTNTLVS